MSTTTTSAPAWFGNTVIEGVQLLVILALPGTPAAETISATALAWIEALWGSPVAWDEHADQRRIAAGFRALARVSERWPAPVALMHQLPARIPPPALPSPPPNPARAAEGLAAVRAVAQQIKMRPAQRGYDAHAVNARMRQEIAK